MSNLTCKGCTREYSYARAKGHTKEYCNSCMQRARQKAIKDVLLEHFGDRCEVCGYNKSRRALTFHHRFDETKEFKLSKANLGMPRLLEEASKCLLVCANCHAEIHENEDEKVRPGDLKAKVASIAARQREILKKLTGE